jgi:class I fructose-bisphosphate aldolase
MHSLRLGRLFNARSGRALDVAVDHGFFGEPAFLTGIEDIRAAIGTLVDAQPDAIQLTLGQARHLAAYATRERPALVLRADVANVYGNPLDAKLFSHHLPAAVEDAARLDAVAICVNLMQIPEHPEIREANIRSILALRSEATKLGMPLMVEPLVMQDNSVAGGIHGRRRRGQDRRPCAPGRRTGGRSDQGRPPATISESTGR